MTRRIILSDQPGRWAAVLLVAPALMTYSVTSSSRKMCSCEVVALFSFSLGFFVYEILFLLRGVENKYIVLRV